MVRGSLLKAQGSWLMPQESWLKAHASWPRNNSCAGSVPHVFFLLLPCCPKVSPRCSQDAKIATKACLNGIPGFAKWKPQTSGVSIESAYHFLLRDPKNTLKLTSRHQRTSTSPQASMGSQGALKQSPTSRNLPSQEIRNMRIHRIQVIPRAIFQKQPSHIHLYLTGSLMALLFWVLALIC